MISRFWWSQQENENKMHWLAWEKLCKRKRKGGDIDTMISRFWWSQQENENKMHWLAWEKLCKRKRKGGLGFRDLHLFNLAMLARQGWRLLTDLNSLCAQVLRAKYYPDGNLLTAVEQKGISYSWRSIYSWLRSYQRWHDMESGQW
jgi:hypothetical protein